MFIGTIIEHTPDQKDLHHGLGHYEVVHYVDENQKVVCGKNVFKFRDPKTVTSKRIFQVNCVNCARHG